jgi:hypothetical protein
MHSIQQRAISRTFLGGLCVGVLGIILVAGLWPFHAPRNDVSWLPNRGLYFGHYGSALARSAFAGSSGKDASGCLELWLKPDSVRHVRTILSFDSPDHPAIPFMVRQQKDGLVVQQPNQDDNGFTRGAWLRVNGVFQSNQPVMLAVDLNPNMTDIYVNGSLARSFPIRGNPTNLSGRLVLAGSPNLADSWSGQILGLAIYGRELSSVEVAADYHTWSDQQRVVVSKDASLRALYLFDEGTGSIAHNLRDTATDLIIPSHFFVLHRAFLRSAWGEHRKNWPFWEDIGINVIGFIPLGFSFAAYFSTTNGTKAALLRAVIFGFLMSLTIEMLQYLLPTRDSGTIDLITNTLGTTIGAALSRWPFAQELMGRAGGFFTTMKTTEELLPLQTTGFTTERR